MNICLVSQEYPPETAWGGIGTTTRNKAHALARLGHTVHVLTRAANQEPEGRREREGSVIVHRMQPPGFEFPIYCRATYLMGYTWHVLRFLHRLADQASLDVIDFPDFGGEGFAYLLDRTCWNWVPVTVQLHGSLAMFVEHMGWPERGTRFARYGTFTEQFCVREADAVMACSASIADLTSRHYELPRSAIDVVHAGVDTALFHPSHEGEVPDNRPTVLFVGNLVENKGVHIVFEAVMRLRARYPDILLQLIGGIPDDSDLVNGFRERLAQEGAEEHVIFLGFVPAEELPAYYHRASLLCSPAAEYESFANVYLEAMACGCPIIVSTAGGGPEAVVDSESGLLVPPGDVPATVEALDRILGDPPLRRRMSQRARRHMEEYFALEPYARRVLAVYEKAIARSRDNPARVQDIRE